MTAGGAQADRRDVRQALNQAGAPQEFQVIEALMARDFSGRGDGNGVGKQEATAIAVVLLVISFVLLSIVYGLNRRPWVVGPWR